MRHDQNVLRTWVALVTTLSLVLTPSAPLLGAWQQEPEPQPHEPVDGGWPRHYETPSKGKVVVYQPQIASWDEQTHMVGYSAVSYEPAGANKTELGTIKLESDTKVALDERLVSFSALGITEANFPSLSPDQTKEVVREINASFPEEERVISLDRILANMDKSHITPDNVDDVKADPPSIFYSTTPAVFLGFDGDPVWSPIQDNDLKFVVNTNWDVFQHGTIYYVRVEESWLEASALEGPWQPSGNLPQSFRKLPDDGNWKDVKDNLPGKILSANEMPKVFVSFEPAELILLDGDPKYEAVPDTGLFWISNTESDVFRMGQDGTVYYLVTGRWFSAPDFNGPWTFATPSLPEDFQKIPLEHERSRILASVPGSDEAIEAVVLADVPKTARVDRNALKAPEVVYQGEPQFGTIEKTSVQRAINTDKDVFKVGDLYYLCFQAVWFTSRTPHGPWDVATAVPKEIYDIPASSPSHHVTYVTIVEDDDKNDSSTTFAYTAGYTSVMIAWGCAVWGTGWYYSPYVWYGGYYPIYYPYARTYGMSAWYNPWTGAYGRGTRVYGPYGGAGFGAAYNPRTGTYARGAAAYGPYGSRSAAHAYNPRTGTYAATRQGRNVYGSWGSSYVQRGDEWAQTARTTNRYTGTTTRATRTDDGAMVSRRGAGNSGFVAGSEGGDMYAGRNGNVYRREDGSWSKYDPSGSWSSVQRPEGSVQRDHAARSEGMQRSRAYSNYRSGGWGGSYRARGGRGRRR